MQTTKKRHTAIARIVIIPIVFLLMLANMVTYAILPVPGSQEAEQADGTIIIVIACGDEEFGWNEDTEGYVIAYDAKSRNWCYAVVEGDAIIPGRQIVGIEGHEYTDRITADDILPLRKDNTGSDSTTFTIVFDTNGGSAISSQTIAANLKATKPANPTKENFTFVSWYMDKELTQVYDFGKVVLGNLTLYAKWTDGTGPAITLVLTIGSRAYTINGNNLTAPIAPVIKNSRTLVPLRLIAEGLGADVDWEHETKTVIISYEGQTITLKIGQLYPDLDVPAEIINDYTMVPIRYIAETFKAKVDWEETTQKVTVITLSHP